MGFINEFPYSDFHELNADWLIKKTKDLINRVKTLEDEMAQIEVMTEDQIRELINNAIADNNIEIFKALDDLHTAVTSEYTTAIQNAINQLKIYVDNQDSYYDNIAHSYADNILVQAKQYTDDKILNYTMMVNPITGQYDDVRNVVNDIVYYFHSENSLTAGEYDALDMTAEDYDTKNLTAYDYDFNGKNLLP